MRERDGAVSQFGRSLELVDSDGPARLISLAHNGRGAACALLALLLRRHFSMILSSSSSVGTYQGHSPGGNGNSTSCWSRSMAGLPRMSDGVIAELCAEAACLRALRRFAREGRSCGRAGPEASDPCSVSSGQSDLKIACAWPETNFRRRKITVRPSGSRQIVFFELL